jgi:hypothetical protein
MALLLSTIDRYIYQLSHFKTIDRFRYELNDIQKMVNILPPPTDQFYSFNLRIARMKSELTIFTYVFRIRSSPICSTLYKCPEGLSSEELASLIQSKIKSIEDTMDIITHSIIFTP